MSWFYLFIAGALETLWAGQLKSLSSGGTPLRIALLIAAMGGSLWLLMLAMRGLPLGVAYPVWTGIGSAGSVLVGALVFGEPVTAKLLIGLVLLVAGMMLISADAV